MMNGEVGRLADETVRLGVRQAETMVLLALAVQLAWLDLWLDGYRTAQAALSAELAQQARTRRLIGRGVSPAAAARELRLV
jgi:hypothetical protein